jgi:hypothetical protein
MSEKRKTTGEGCLYVITNPAWPGYCKIGRSTGVTERLRTYQTASPKRDFQLRYTRSFGDILAAERALKKLLPGFRARGEWLLIHPDDAATLIDGLPPAS